MQTSSLHFPHATSTYRYLTLLTMPSRCTCRVYVKNVLSYCHLEGKVNRAKAIHRTNFDFLIRSDIEHHSCSLGIARTCSTHIPFSNDGLTG